MKKTIKPEDELRRRAEESLREGGPPPDPVDRNGTDAVRLVHELRVHQVELEMQNEELRETRARAEESLAQYLDLYEFAPQPYITVDRSGKVLRANLAAASAFGVARSRLIDRSLGERAAPRSRPDFAAFLERTLASCCEEGLDIPLRRENGEELIFHIVGLSSDAGAGECRLALMDVTERERAREALARAGHEKETLMRELQHRVKNNLNVVYSLLGLGLSRTEDPEAREVLQKAGERVMAMAKIYEELYLEGAVLAVELKPYLEKLIVSLVETYASEGSSISAVSRLEEVQLDAQRAVLAGLMLSELISNATKYAFSGREKGELRIVLDRVGGRVELSVSDDGPGLPAGFDPATSGNMGFYLLRMLSDQMRAELVVTSPPGGGVTVALRFDP